MLVLATDDDELLRAAGLEQLDAEGYVEPVVAPSRPLHLLAQQLLALCLQHGRVGRQTRTGTLLELRTSGGGLECLHMGAGLHEWSALARSAA